MRKELAIFLIILNILLTIIFTIGLILTVTYAGSFLHWWTLILFAGLYFIAVFFKSLLKTVYPGIASYTVPEGKVEKTKMETAKIIATGVTIFYPLHFCLSLFLLFHAPCGCKIVDECQNSLKISSHYCQNFLVQHRTSLFNGWTLSGLSVVILLIHCLVQYCFIRFIGLKLVRERVAPVTEDPRLTRPTLELKEKRKAFGQRQDTPYT